MGSPLGTLHYFDHNLDVHRVVVGSYANNVFVVRCKHTGDAVLIDAANEHERLLICAGLWESGASWRPTDITITSRQFPRCARPATTWP
jgi:hypothetical protein